MLRDRLKQLLGSVARGETTAEKAAELLDACAFETLGALAKVDHGRELRSGTPEVVYGEGKSASDIATILRSLSQRGAGALATRVSAEKAEVIVTELADLQCNYDGNARLVSIAPETLEPTGRGEVAVVSAGTSDRAIAEEAALTLEFLGHTVNRFSDVGVAGLQRLLSVVEDIRRNQVVIAIAGMEGALPTVLAGLIDVPIIAVPTSVGYGIGQGGYAALAGMLSSCSPGLTVVNIDNGFGAAVAASRMNRNDSGDERLKR